MKEIKNELAIIGNRADQMGEGTVISKVEI